MSDTRTETSQEGATSTPKEREQTLDEYQQGLFLQVQDDNDPLTMEDMMRAVTARAMDIAADAKRTALIRRELDTIDVNDGGNLSWDCRPSQRGSNNANCMLHAFANPPAFLEIMRRELLKKASHLEVKPARGNPYTKHFLGDLYIGSTTENGPGIIEILSLVEPLYEDFIGIAVKHPSVK